MFEAVGVFLSFNLRECGVGGFVVFQFNKERGDVWVFWCGLEDDIGITFSAVKLQNRCVVFLGSVVGELDGVA